MCVWIYRGKVQPEPRDTTNQRIESLKQTQTPPESARALTQDTATTGKSAATEQVATSDPQG